jgi:hypothetical protein
MLSGKFHPDQKPFGGLRQNAPRTNVSLYLISNRKEQMK